MSAQTSKFMFLMVVVGVIMTIYQQFDKIKSDMVAEKRMYEDTFNRLKTTVDELKAELRKSETQLEKLKSEVSLYKKDKTGLVDYAFGGRVVSIKDSETLEYDGVEFLGMKLCGSTYLERRILESSVMPGDCWPVRGQGAAAVIELIEEIFVTKVSLEHASKELLPIKAIISAPKEFSIWGLPSEDDDSPGSSHLFGHFLYQTTGPDVQTFPIQHASSRKFKIIEFRVHSNHGHPEFTCIYRVRIHGTQT